MKIGLVRHFKVDYNFGKYLNSLDIEKELNRYENSEIIKKPVYISDEWEICYASPSKRTVETAEHIFKGKIEKNDNLKEVNIEPRYKLKVKLPVILWIIIISFSWKMNSKKINEKYSESYKRAANLIGNVIKNNKNTLLITHGFFMNVLKKVLYKMGFKGQNFFLPENGKLYIFEKK